MNPINELLIDSWRLSLHAKRPKTIEYYTREARRFSDWYGKPLTEATKDDVLRWVNIQRAQQKKPNTIRSRVMVVRAFCNWAVEEGELAFNPCDGVDVPKGKEPPPEVLSPPQLAALIRACEGTTFLDRRDMAIVRLLAATGLRASELTGLEVGDFDFQARVAYVRDGKGGHSRTVKFDAATAAALDRYRRARARHPRATERAFWLGQRGPLKPSGGLSLLLRRRASMAGIGHVFPHQLRHTFADRFLDAGGKEGDLQTLGGWQSAEIMRRYGASRRVDRALGAYDDVDPMRGL